MRGPSGERQVSGFPTTKCDCVCFLRIALLMLLLGVVLVASQSDAQASSVSCGRVRLNNPEISFRVYMRVRNVSCRHAVRVAESSLFGQGGPPIDGWTCPHTSSIRGHCKKGRKELSYADKRKHIPSLARRPVLRTGSS